MRVISHAQDTRQLQAGSIRLGRRGVSLSSDQRPASRLKTRADCSRAAGCMVGVCWCVKCISTEQIIVQVAHASRALLFYRYFIMLGSKHTSHQSQNAGAHQRIGRACFRSTLCHKRRIAREISFRLHHIDSTEARHHDHLLLEACHRNLQSSNRGQRLSFSLRLV